jgi:hypothetical protein
VSFFARGIGPTFLLFNIMIHNSYACSKSAFMIYELSKSLSMICKWHCADDKVKSILVIFSYNMLDKLIDCLSKKFLLSK